MKASQLLLLTAAAAATPIVARVIEARDESIIEYEGYLPVVPDGWPNIIIGTNSTNTALSIRTGSDIYAGLATSCKQFTEETRNAVECVCSAIGQVVAVSILVYRGYLWRANLAQRLNENGWYVPGITKRDEWASLMTRQLSDGLKTEVRHLGTWDGVSSNQKRGEDSSEPAVPREVFGINYDGLDLHFTYMGQNDDGAGVFKFGLGDATIPNEEDIRNKRDMGNSNFYFSQGGIDFEAQSVEENADTAWSWLSITDSTELDSIYTAVKCYMKPFFYILSNAAYYQIYDSYSDATLAVGMMSPFSSTRDLPFET